MTLTFKLIIENDAYHPLIAMVDQANNRLGKEGSLLARAATALNVIEVRQLIQDSLTQSTPIKNYYQQLPSGKTKLFIVAAVIAAVVPFVIFAGCIYVAVTAKGITTAFIIAKAVNKLQMITAPFCLMPLAIVSSIFSRKHQVKLNFEVLTILARKIDKMNQENHLQMRLNLKQWMHRLASPEILMTLSDTERKVVTEWQAYQERASRSDYVPRVDVNNQWGWAY